jgi:hypothetical protein
MKKHFIVNICTSLLLLFSASVLADDVGYEVEVIIFEDTTGKYKHSEKWPEAITAESETSISNDEILNDKKAAKTTEESERIFFGDIAKENYRLTKQAMKLEKHADYRILSHKAWKQRGLDRKQAQPIKISSTTTPENDTDTKLSYIDGDVTLIMSRYLHFATNLVFHKSKPKLFNSFTDVEDSAENNYINYPIIFERRMRSKEIHYLDHPLLGIIVLAIPFKIKPEEVQQPLEYKTL